MRICIVGASGKLGQYMVQHALDRGYEVVGVCRAESVEKLNAFKGRITVIQGATNDAEVIKRALSGCDGVRPSRRARVRACPCGAGTWATPFSRATSRAAWTL